MTTTQTLTLLGILIVLTPLLWHLYNIHRHRQAITLVKEMKAWRERNKFDLDDYGESVVMEVIRAAIICIAVFVLGGYAWVLYLKYIT